MNERTDHETTNELLDELVVIQRRTEVTLELIEQNLGVLVYRALPFWRRWMLHLRHATETVDRSMDELRLDT